MDEVKKKFVYEGLVSFISKMVEETAREFGCDVNDVLLDIKENLKRG